MANEQKEQGENLLKLMRDILEHDEALRKKYQIGEKFRFIRDRLQTLFSKVEEQVMVFRETSEQSKGKTITEDEILVYVYLYNAQGLLFKTWQKMVSAEVLYEYSVNRPVYAEHSQVESFIRNKSNKAQHAYLTIAIKKQDILLSAEKEPLKDPLGHTLLKVREGSLHVDRIISFVHNGLTYILDKTGGLVKKE